MTIWLSKSAKEELKSFSAENQANVSAALSLLEDNDYREQNKIDLCLVEEGCDIWALLVRPVWIAFHEDKNQGIYVDWISLRSRFRP